MPPKCHSYVRQDLVSHSIFCPHFCHGYLMLLAVPQWLYCSIAQSAIRRGPPHVCQSRDENRASPTAMILTFREPNGVARADHQKMKRKHGETRSNAMAERIAHVRCLYVPCQLLPSFRDRQRLATLLCRSTSLHALKLGRFASHSLTTQPRARKCSSRRSALICERSHRKDQVLPCPTASQMPFIASSRDDSSCQ